MVNCPCCRYDTLEGSSFSINVYETCVLCGWEYNGQDDFYADADTVQKGANNGLSLAKAQQNFKKPPDSHRKEDWLYWKVDHYFDRSVEEWRYFDVPPIYSFHRPLSEYFKSLIRNGFILSDFEEPVPAKKVIEEHYRDFGNEHDIIPWFLIIGATKKRQ